MLSFDVLKITGTGLSDYILIVFFISLIFKKLF